MINYRSAALYGTGRLLTGPEEKADALFCFSEKVLPGRRDECRPMTDQELKATAIVALDIEDAVAKIRTGPPKDEDEDISWPTWAGVIPVEERYLHPIADKNTPADTPSADSVAAFMAAHSSES